VILNGPPSLLPSVGSPLLPPKTGTRTFHDEQSLGWVKVHHRMSLILGDEALITSPPQSWPLSRPTFPFPVLPDFEKFDSVRRTRPPVYPSAHLFSGPFSHLDSFDCPGPILTMVCFERAPLCPGHLGTVEPLNEFFPPEKNFPRFRKGSTSKHADPLSRKS